MDGWPHLKHKKPKKLRKTCIRASDIEKLFEKSHKETRRIFYTPFFGSSEIFDAGARFFSFIV